MHDKKVNPGARWELRVDGVPRSYRDDRAIAIGSAEYLKERNPTCEVTVRDLEGKEETVVIPSQLLKLAAAEPLPTSRHSRPRKL